MSANEEEDGAIYKVLVNHEDQYSLWLADLDVPAGWRETGQSGPRAECLAYVEAVWTDMRPASLRRKMEGQAVPPAGDPAPPGAGDDQPGTSP
jgi:MbtH protein